MGVIKFEPSETIPERSWGLTRPLYFMHITNWRILCEHETNDTIFVTVGNFKTFEVENLTIEELFAVNTNMDIISRPFKYGFHLLSCDKCHGIGKVDWVKNVINVMPKHGTLFKTFRRNGKHITKFDPPFSYEGIKSMIGSVPIVDDGYELCPSCKGTGIYI